MPDPLAIIVGYLVDDGWPGGRADLRGWLAEGGPAGLTAAFLVALAGPDQPLAEAAQVVLGTATIGLEEDLRRLYVQGLASVRRELRDRSASEPAFSATLAATAAVLNDAPDADRASEAIWSVLYPEAVGLRQDVEGAIDELRRRRLVRIEAFHPEPIVDAAREVLFTSNVLLGLPLDAPAGDPALDPVIADAVARARAGRQLYWFDHPIPIGVEPAANELLHGLRGLDAAMRAEGAGRRLTCLLSVSVTHAELRGIAARYLDQMGGIDELQQVDVLVATETDVRQLVDEVIGPAIARFGPRPATGSVDLDVLGVDGEYGRHYSFLKAIAAIWHVLFDPAVRGTFKIDLDQVFPEPELITETGRTALQHLETPLWGATGRDSAGRPIELGLLAGALVNASDIGRGLFTPDVAVPTGSLRPSDHAFFSPLPQAISTRAEMSERYDTPLPDGIGSALERVHVTGGTSGILVDALRRHRPFTPTFIGRAEDQAYALSVQGRTGPRLACLHAAGLIMRHDKEAYAGAAIEASLVGKLVGDDVRILAFSAYARALAAGSGTEPTIDSIKALMDPFTGGFISRLPVTVVLLRFALRILEAFSAGGADVGRAYAELGSQRLAEALTATADTVGVRALIDAERAQWDDLYDTLDGLEAALAAGDVEALHLRQRARELIDGWRLRAFA
ncbi:MAG TPA: hypothetical protein VKR24_01965 [Candidatus Limnocylindrales bacterium]|nr:hypothetical protein [Candidatus Limnocylindrales bacterium]